MFNSYMPNIPFYRLANFFYIMAIPVCCCCCLFVCFLVRLLLICFSNLIINHNQCEILAEKPYCGNLMRTVISMAKQHEQNPGNYVGRSGVTYTTDQ